MQQQRKYVRDEKKDVSRSSLSPAFSTGKRGWQVSADAPSVQQQQHFALVTTLATLLTHSQCSAECLACLLAQVSAYPDKSPYCAV